MAAEEENEFCWLLQKILLAVNEDFCFSKGVGPRFSQVEKVFFVVQMILSCSITQKYPVSLKVLWL